jgi:hypothetical protein
MGIAPRHFHAQIDTRCAQISVVSIDGGASVGVLFDIMSWSIRERDLDEVFAYFSRALTSPHLDHAPIRVGDGADLVMGFGTDRAQFWISCGCTHISLDRETAQHLLVALSAARKFLFEAKTNPQPKELRPC